MNFIESLSLSTGLKIDKPFIDDSFFPIVAEKYITFCTEGHSSKQWDHFQEYIDLIFPIIEKNNIKIVEIGSNKKVFSKVTNLKGATNENHWSYIIKKSMLHIGPENLISQLCSLYNIPFIAFFSNTSPEYASPSWSKPSPDQIFIKGYKDGESPSFAGEESPKTINNISAEEVANKTLNILGLDNDLGKFNIINIGQSYHQKLVEVVPDFIPDESFFPRSLINIRMDFEFNESALPSFASKRKISIISDKEVKTDIIMHLKPSIQMFYFKVDELSDFNYIKNLKDNGIAMTLIAKDTADISLTRLRFFDYKVEEDFKTTKKDLDNIEKICDTTRYKSSKTIFSKDGEFSSKSSYDKKINKHSDQLIIDNKDFWEDLHHFKLYNLE